MTEYPREHWEELLRTIISRLGMTAFLDILGGVLDEDLQFVIREAMAMEAERESANDPA